MTSWSLSAKKRASLSLVLALVTCALSASAEPSASERETARTLILSGRAKRKAGHMKEALADFERAHGIMHVPTTGLDLGKTQVSLGLLVEGRATLLESAHYPTTPGEPHAFTKARQEARQLAEEVAPRLATLTITVRAGAKVKIDDAEISSSSIDTPLKMNPGKHEIVASMEGGKEKRVAIELAERETKSFAIDVDAPDTKPPPPPPPPIPPPKPESSGTSSLVWIGLATAGIGAAVGTTTGVIALTTKSDVSGRCVDGTKCPPETHADIEQGKTFGTISTISFIIAGVGAAVLITGLFGVGRPSPTAWHLGPTGVSGRF